MNANFKELLEDFNLQDTSENFMYLRENLNLLQYKQDLFDMYIRYPGINYIDRKSYYNFPLILEQPPKSLLYLSDCPFSQLWSLKDAFNYLVLVPEDTTLKLDWLIKEAYALGGSRRSYITCSQDLPDSIKILDEELWLVKDGFSLSIKWLLRSNSVDYNKLKELVI